MTTEEISIVVNGIAVLASPIIAVIVSMWINNKNQKKKYMVDIFKTLMTTRNRPYGNEEVRKSLKELRDEYSKAIDMQKVRNKQLKLIPMGIMLMVTEYVWQAVGYLTAI